MPENVVKLSVTNFKPILSEENCQKICQQKSTASFQELRAKPPGIEWKTGRNPKMGKNWPKNRKWPSARNGEKVPKNCEKMGFGVIFLFFRRFWAIFSPSRAEGHFLFFGQCFPIVGFRPIFHSIPGGLTRNSRTHLCHHQPKGPILLKMLQS